MQTRLKDYYSPADCRRLRRLFIQRMKEIQAEGRPIHLLLSGGIDSVTPLYAMLEAKIPFVAHTFYFKGMPSSDLKMVQQIAQCFHYDQRYIELPATWESLRDDVVEAVDLCLKEFGRIREVKVETLLAIMLAKRKMPSEPITVVSGMQVVLMYTRNDAMFIAREGEFSPVVEAARRGKFNKERSEPEILFDHAVSPYNGGCVEDFLCHFTVSACHRPQPKAILYYAFEDYHRKAASYRRPRPFHKACNEKALFNGIAVSLGYKNALELFKAVSRHEQ